MLNLVIALSLFLLMALLFIVYPFRRHLKWACLGAFVFSVLSLSLYGLWGGYSTLHDFNVAKKRDKLARLALKNLRTPEEVIAKLKEAIQKRPDDAKGWYLLGRLYRTSNDNPNAQKAFFEAYRLDNKDLPIRFEWMQSLYIANGGHVVGEVKLLLDGILTEFPEQPDALNFMIIDAYNHKDYQTANNVLQRLLVILPKGTKEHEMVLKTIAVVQKKIQEGVGNG
jgi:cytochrome c-type biogenesis protein CcmH/NrfG